MEGRGKAGLPLWQTRQRKGKGKSTKEMKSGRSRPDKLSVQQHLRVICPAVPSFLQRPTCLPTDHPCPGGLGNQGTLQLQKPLLGILKNLKIGVSWEWPFFSCKAMVQTTNRQRHKPCRMPEKKKGNKKVQKNLSRKNRVPGPKGTLPVDFSRSIGSGQTVKQATINLRGWPKSLLPEATSTPDPHPWGRPSCSFLLGPLGF